MQLNNPKDLCIIIIGEMHCSPMSGHRDITKTYHRIKHNYYWENKIRHTTAYSIMFTIKKSSKSKT